MKRITICLIIALMFLFPITSVSATTLRELKEELAELQEQKANNDNKKKLTEEEMATIDNRILKITKLITESEEKIQKLTDEIIVLQEESSKKNDEIKDVFAFLQVTESNNAYLEYIFGAQSITDLIFRTAISEQLVEYNNDLIIEYNETIKEHNEKRDELDEEIQNLDAEQENLKDELVKLGDTIDDIVEINVDIDDDIDSLKKTIEYYESNNCDLDTDISKCGTIPYTGTLIRPIVTGVITSDYGWRKNPLGSGTKFHNGIDFSGGSDKVYSVGPGVVKYIRWHIQWPNARKEQDCGGNMLFIEHNVNGTSYVSGYYHLRSVLVSVGEYVDQNTLIGYMGGSPKTTPWDRCSTGMHLHFALGRGPWKNYNTYIAKQVNPRTLVNLPAKGAWISNRTKKY